MRVCFLQAFKCRLKRTTLKCSGGMSASDQFSVFLPLKVAERYYLSPDNKHKGCNYNASQEGQLLFPHYYRLQRTTLKFECECGTQERPQISDRM